MTAANIIASFLLMGIERLLEIGYRCPGSVGMRIAYISSFFIIPFGSIILLGYFFQIHVFKMTAKGHIQRFCIFLRSSVPACIWIVILLLDGKYIECVTFSEFENCPKENSCDSTASAISKVRFPPFLSFRDFNKNTIEFLLVVLIFLELDAQESKIIHRLKIKLDNEKTCRQMGSCQIFLNLFLDSSTGPSHNPRRPC